MCIMNFIKNYPVLIVICIVSTICFSLLAIPQKIYAQSQIPGKNPNCDCITKDCPNNVEPTKQCSLDRGVGGFGRCNCNLGEGISSIEKYGSCTDSTATRCVRTKGCSNCTPYDCNPINPCTGNGTCKGCIKYRVTSGVGNCNGIQRGLDGEIISCGNCSVEKAKVDLSVV